MDKVMTIKAFKIEGNGTFAKDVPAIADAIKSSGAEIVLLPGNSRVKRSAAAAAMRAGAEIDTNVVDLDVADGKADALTAAAENLYTIAARDAARKNLQRSVLQSQEQQMLPSSLP